MQVDGGGFPQVRERGYHEWRCESVGLVGRILSALGRERAEVGKGDP